MTRAGGRRARAGRRAGRSSAPQRAAARRTGPRTPLDSTPAGPPESAAERPPAPRAPRGRAALGLPLFVMVGEQAGVSRFEGNLKRGETGMGNRGRGGHKGGWFGTSYGSTPSSQPRFAAAAYLGAATIFHGGPSPHPRTNWAARFIYAQERPVEYR